MKIVHVYMPEFLYTLENSNAPHLCFDAETRPESTEYLAQFYDESAVKLPSHPGEFDRAAIKTGNLKDPAKIVEKIEASKAAHVVALRDFVTETEKRKREAWEAFVEDSTLSSLYSQVCALGYGLYFVGRDDSPYLVVATDIDTEGNGEENLLLRFWQAATLVRARRGRLIGHNSNKFDIPSITRRSWKYGIGAPYLMTQYRAMEDFCVDTLIVWRMGDSRAKGKLDHVAKALGVQGKLAGVTGDMFWKLLRDGSLDTARAYLASDIIATAGVAERMGLLM